MTGEWNLGKHLLWYDRDKIKIAITMILENIKLTDCEAIIDLESNRVRVDFSGECECFEGCVKVASDDRFPVEMHKESDPTVTSCISPAEMKHMNEQLGTYPDRRSTDNGP